VCVKREREMETEREGVRKRGRVGVQEYRRDYI